MKSTPYLIQPGTAAQPLTRIDPQQKLYAESWLQELLQNHPDLLPVEEFEEAFSNIAPIGREIPTNVGPIDNLFISGQGCLVLVETKLWRNPEAKREVLAQVIDYAAEVSQWSFGELDEKARKYAHKSLIEIIRSISNVDSDDIPTENRIGKNLRLGRFLILIVSDHIRSSLVDMLAYVNRYPHLATHVGLVELQCYQMPGSPGDMVVVPSIVAKTEIVERSIVQVNLLPETAHTLTVEQIQSEPGSKSRRSISEDEFWETLQQKSPASVELARKILDHFRSHSETSLKMGGSSVIIRMIVPDTDRELSLFHINTDGALICWPVTLQDQLEGAGLERELGAAYEKKLSRFLTRRTGINSIQCPVESVAVEPLIAVVDEFIEAILTAVSQGD